MHTSTKVSERVGQGERLLEATVIRGRQPIGVGVGSLHVVVHGDARVVVAVVPVEGLVLRVVSLLLVNAHLLHTIALET